MGADELHERLTGWIETSGRTLELRTARTFRGRPFAVVGMVLDDDTDWDEVAELVTESYRFCAPRS